MTPFSNNFLKSILEASWQGSLVIMLILLLRPLLGLRVPARWRYALWTLVLVRLLVPAFVLPRSPASLQNLAVVDRPFEQAGKVFAGTTGPAPVPSQGPDDVGAGTVTAVPPPVAKRPWWQVAAAVWVVGAALTATWILVGTILLHRRVRRDTTAVAPDIESIWRRCCAELGLRRPPRLLATGCVESPALVGLWRPALLLPRQSLPSFSAEDWEHVFLHELAHFRRRDHWSQALQLVALCAHWFNPLVWIGFRCLRTDRELAADEWALRHLRGERAAAYGDTLLKVLTAQSHAGFTPGLVGITEDGAQMKQRLRHIISFAPRRLAGSIAGVAVALALAAVVLGQSALKADLSGYAGLSPVDTLVTAARRGDQPVVEKMLADGVDINGLTSLRGEHTALAAATATQQIEMVRLLVDKGASLDLKPDKTDAPVVIALKRGWTDCADFLLSKGAACPPEMVAAAKGDAAVIGKFLQSGTADLETLKTCAEIAAAKGQGAVYDLLDDGIRATPGGSSWQPSHGMLISAVANGHRVMLEKWIAKNSMLKEGGVVRLGAAAARTPGMAAWLRTKGFKVPDYNDGERLIDAAEREDLPEIRRLIAQGTDINYRGESDWTPLSKAVTWGSPKAVKLLLENFADPHQRRYNSYTMLELAKTPEIADMLVAAGVKVQPRDMVYGVINGTVELVQWFLDHGVDPSKMNQDDDPLLGFAKSPEIAELLIARGADVNAKGKNGETAILHQLQFKDAPAGVVAVLLKHGVDPNGRDYTGLTPLMRAPDGPTVDVLVAAGADLNAQDDRGNGVLVSGWHSSAPSRAQALLRHGLKLDAATGASLLLNAVSLRHDVAAVKMLLAMGVDPNIPNQWQGRPQSTALEVATTSGDFEIAEILRGSGANDVGQLSEAAAKGDLVQMKALLEAGANVNERSSGGMTPLQFAIYQGQAASVRLLLERGANVNTFNTFGYTPAENVRDLLGQIQYNHFTQIRRLDMPAAKKALDEIDAAINARKPDPNFRDANGETALMVAARSGVTLALSPREPGTLNINAQRPDGMTALMLAIEGQPKNAPTGAVEKRESPEGKVKESYSARGYVVKTLIDNGADLSIRNQAGKTALDLARENGNPEILEMVVKAAEKRQ